MRRVVAIPPDGMSELVVLRLGVRVLRWSAWPYVIRTGRELRDSARIAIAEKAGLLHSDQQVGGGTLARVSRFTANGDQAEPGSARVLLEIKGMGKVPANAPIAGALQFGTDGKLYIGVGDAGHRGRASSLRSPFGKVLRINPDGTVPADNPFAATSKNDVTRALWTGGLHDPFTLASDPVTGRTYINEEGRPRAEQIEIGTAGGHYGWL